MKKTIYETNFDRLEKLGIVKDGKAARYAKSLRTGLMDLVVERLDHEECMTRPDNKDVIVISLAHYFEQHGDLCQDPEMVLYVYPSIRMVEAYSFQQAIPTIYQVVYPEPGKFYPRLKKDLNAFLGQWLHNLIAQGHGKNWVNSEGRKVA